MPTDFFVFSTEVKGEERFFVLLPGSVPPGMPRPSSAVEALSTFQQYLRMPPLMTEEDMRRQLTEIGLPTEEVEGRIHRARKFRQMPVILERTTAIGHRNVDGQVVVRKTDLEGTLPYQRIYVVRCGQCAHEYGRNGCDIHSSQCPNCQDGRPGLSVTGS